MTAPMLREFLLAWPRGGAYSSHSAKPFNIFRAFHPIQSGAFNQINNPNEKMKRIITLGVTSLSFALFASCATVLTQKADLAKKPNGVRVYPPKVYLMVDTVEKKTTLAYLPDYSRAYDVLPVTIFAKQDFK